MKFMTTLTIVLSASCAIAQDPSGDVQDSTSTEEILTPEMCEFNHKDEIRHWLDQTDLPDDRRSEVYTFDQVFVFDRAYTERICSCPYSRVPFEEYRNFILSYGGDTPSASIIDFLDQSLSFIGVSNNSSLNDKWDAFDDEINNKYETWLEWCNNDKECLSQLEDGFNAWVEKHHFESLPEDKNWEVYLGLQGGLLVQ